MRVGADVFVAFSPERIDPGNPEHLQRDAAGGRRDNRTLHYRGDTTYSARSLTWCIRLARPR